MALSAKLPADSAQDALLQSELFPVGLVAAGNQVALQQAATPPPDSAAGRAAEDDEHAAAPVSPDLHLWTFHIMWLPSFSVPTLFLKASHSGRVCSAMLAGPVWVHEGALLTADCHYKNQGLTAADSFCFACCIDVSRCFGSLVCFICTLLPYTVAFTLVIASCSDNPSLSGCRWHLADI